MQKNAMASLARQALALSLMSGSLYAMAQTTIMTSTFDTAGVAVSPCTGTGEPTVSGVLPTGWVENTCWKTASGSSVTYALDTSIKYAGASSLSVKSSGTTAQFYAPFSMKANMRYRVTLYLRGEVSQDVTVQLRLAGPPYTSYGVASTTVNNAGWSKVTVIADAPLTADRVDAGLFILPTNPGSKIWLDSVTLTEQASPAPLATVGQTVAKSYFGMHTHRDLKWPDLGGTVGAERFWDGEGIQMGDIFPTSDLTKANWTKFEERIARAQKNGADIVFTLGGNLPAWATMSLPNVPGCNLYGPGTSSPPASRTVWRDMVKAVVTRAAGRIKYWQIWNEPSICATFNDRTNGDMTLYLVYLAKDAHSIIKAASTSNVVLSPSLVLSQLEFADQYFAKGGGAYADIVSVHAYDEFIGNQLGSAPTHGYLDGPERLFIKDHVILNFKNILEKYSLASKTIWSTEAGYLDCATVANTPDDTKGAPYVARHMLLAGLAGLSRSYHYSWDMRDNRVALGRELDVVGSNNYSKTDAGRAYENMAKWLMGAKISAATYPAQQGKAWVVTLDRAGVKQYIVWNPTGESIGYTVPAGMTAATSLLGVKNSVSGTTLMVNGWPQLLTVQ